MKFIKSLFKNLTITFSLLTIFSCSVESIENDQLTYSQPENESNLTCTDAQPEARFTNNGSVAFTFTIISANLGQIAEFTNVAPGTTTNWTAFTAGDILFSFKSSSTGVVDIKTLAGMQNCDTYELEIQSDNTLLPGSPLAN